MALLVGEGEQAADRGRGRGGKGEGAVNLCSLTAQANFVNWLGFSGSRAEIYIEFIFIGGLPNEPPMKIISTCGCLCQSLVEMNFHRQFRR